MASTKPEPTMKDVASRAGVGMATVSRALSGGQGVAEGTMARVLSVAEALGYVVSPAASSLARGATNRVAVIVPHLSRWICAATVDALEVRLRRENFDLLLYQVEDAAARHRFFSELPARRKADAVIVVALPVSPAERDGLEMMGVQVVAAGGQIVDYPYVCIDDHEAARQAVDHLLLLGHRRIAMIDSIDPEFVDWPRSEARVEGYRRALATAGVDHDQSLLVTAGWGGESGADAMSDLLSRPHPPTAVFAYSDEVAVGAVRTIRRAGLRVPEDISVIGIDDNPIASLTDLTTVQQPVTAIANAAGDLLVDLLTGRVVETQITIPTRLIPRGSTARPSR